jgi:hypothetical protein
LRNNTTDKRWLPPCDEWDFRSVTVEQCRRACLWEYLRSERTIVADVQGWVKGKGSGTTSAASFLRGTDLSLPWLTANKISNMMFSIGDIKDLNAFIKRLNKHVDPVSKFLWENFPRALRKTLTAHRRGADNNRVQTSLVEGLNRILCGDCIYDKDRFTEVPLAEDTRRIAMGGAKGDDLIRLNRMHLEAAFPLEISRNAQIQRLGWAATDAELARPIQIRSMASLKKRILDRIGLGLDPVRVINQVLQASDYVLRANFVRGGTERITADLESWARKEGRKFPRAPRAKAAEPPYAYLKWLAAYRLEEARKKERVSRETVQTTLDEHRKSWPVDKSADTLPIYASQGTWSKVIGCAKDLLDLLNSDPKAFEKKLLF